MSRSMALVLVLLVLFLTSQSEWKPPRTATDLSGKKLNTEEDRIHKIQEDIILELTDENYRLKKLVEALNVQLHECKKRIPNRTLSGDASAGEVGEVGEVGDANSRTEERSQLEEKSGVEDGVLVETPQERAGAADSALAGVGGEPNTEGSGESDLEGGKAEATVEARENGSSSLEEGLGQRRRKAAEQLSDQLHGDTNGVSAVLDAGDDGRTVERTVDWVVPRSTLTSLSKVLGDVATSSSGQVSAEESATNVFVDGIRSGKEGGGPSRPIERRHGADQARVRWAKNTVLGGHRFKPLGRYGRAEVGSV
ncbi:hypothetical protein CBR_g37138 [Chara braunii]|uniref:Uncharacterized protein n=1 Tax=Chara braunii TaxID=69332 RepID=A0A388LMG5_CHABU|nr:hypothetical protein CBR_g37138 [Chara braunii]|eukprot:GBG83425.1 hypothetical protein CBR_g37138 [Chara braunii]